MGGRRHIARLAVLSIFVFTGVGCQGWEFKGDRAIGARSPEAEGAWPFAPVAMRIAPFTRVEFDEQANTLIIAAHVELLDVQGDATKGIGEFRFELYADQPTAARQGQDRRVQWWNASLLTLDENAQHYDSVTRTYRFKLQVTDPPKPDRKLSLAAVFTDTYGRRLLANATITVDPSPATAEAWINAVR